MRQLVELYANSAEYRNDLPDMFGRARFYNSTNQDIFNPLISSHIYSSGLKPYYPGNRQFAVCVSHDVDHLYLHQTSSRKMLNAGKDFLKGRFGQGFNQLGSLRKEEVFKDYDLNNLIAINKEYAVKSTYYFLSLNVGDQDFNYPLAGIRDQLDAVIRSEGEIGLHGGHSAYNDLAKLMQEKNGLDTTLDKPVCGYRNHYLRFELPSTWNNLQKAGFLYDATLGYPDCIGFRNGMCYPFFPFDVRQRKFLDIIELPLIIMDATLFFYMRMNSEVAFSICKRVIEKIMSCNGVLTLLWHNNFISGEMGAFYLRLLDYLRSMDPWYATSEDLVKWWKNEGFLEKSQAIVNEFFMRA